MRIWIASIAGLCALLATSASAQPLADLARQEAARRQTIVHPPAVYTNADLKVWPAPIAPVYPLIPAVMSYDRLEFASRRLPEASYDSYWSVSQPAPAPPTVSWNLFSYVPYPQERQRHWGPAGRDDIWNRPPSATTLPAREATPPRSIVVGGVATPMKIR